MTDSELLLLDAEFWFGDSHRIIFPENTVDRLQALYYEWEIDPSCKFIIHSWFALLLSEVLK